MSTVRRHRFAVGLGTAVLAMAVPDALLVGRQQAPQPQPTAPRSPAPVFRTGVNLVLVDVVVRDKSGGIVRNLTADDFDLLEDGLRQQIVTFTFEEINTNAASVTSTATLSAATATGRRGAGASTVTATPVAPATAPSAPAADAVPAPLTSEAVAGHRLITLLFDTSSMQPEDLQKAAESAVKWVAEEMSPADLVAVASIGSTLQILSDFTGSKEAVRSAVAAFSPTDSTAFTTVDASTAATDEANSAATDDTATVDASAQELDTFNNDVRLRALKTLAEALMPIQQKRRLSISAPAGSVAFPFVSRTDRGRGRKIEVREGYYADRDFAHTAKTDREVLLQQQLSTQIPATDVPLFVSAGWFRMAADKFYVPVALAVPGSAVPSSTDKVTLDVAGFIRDERGFPVGRIRDTLTVPPAGANALAARQVLYQTGVTLPPGRFR